MDEITRAIEGLTRRVHAYRTFESFKKGDLNMALELKGLKGRAMTARAHIGKLDAAYEAFNAKAGNHVSDVEGLTEQLGEMADDLSFATTTLGNSVAASNDGVVEKPKDQSAEKDRNTASGWGNVAVVLPEGQQTASPEVELPAPTFRAAE